MASKLILTADDYGACDYIDSGIIKAIRERRLNSVAAFVCFPDSPERIEKLIQVRKDEKLSFGIGLHFSATAGFPLTEAKSLRRNANDLTSPFKAPEDFFDKSAYDRNELSREIEAQFHALEAILHDSGYDKGSKQVDSLSNHHGVLYLDNKLFRDYIRIAEFYELPIRSPQPWSTSKLKKLNLDRKLFNPAVREGLKLGFLQRFWSAPGSGKRVRLADERGLLFPYCLLDEFYGQPSAGYLQFLLNNYNSKTFASEFMFHLGDPALRHEMNALVAANQGDLVLPGINFGYFDNRERELAELTATPLPSLVKNNKITLCTFRDLDVDDSLDPR
jgi:predicted glycoside hydrolase/deacetylase ChbG (UPF0249 family)